MSEIDPLGVEKVTTLVPFISVSNPWGLCMTSEYILNFLPTSKLIQTKESIWNSVRAFFCVLL